MISEVMKFILFLFIYLVSSNVSAEQFNFDVTELEILENGNKFIGSERGKITTKDGIYIEADRFEFIKNQNLLNASGSVKVVDELKNYIIFSDNIIYKKNEELIFTKSNSRAISINDSLEINANDFKFFRNKNILRAEKNVTLEDKIENYKINSNFISYDINLNKINSKGKTSGVIHSKYNFNSEDVIFLRNSMEISSKKNTSLRDKLNLYNLTNFKYLINKEELRGENITVQSNYNLPKSDKFYFDRAIIDLKSQNFLAENTEIKIHKDIFNNTENDPRLKGVSSSKKGEITKIKKGIFTSCGKRDGCPPWSIQADEIIHDKEKRNLFYNNATVKIYDIPVFYFPKFFHPDPSVKRQTGFLKPKINKSNVIGNTINLPYYQVISDNKDFTFSPTISDSGAKIFQGEYRQENRYSSLIADVGFVNNFKSNYSNNKKNIIHLFAKSELELNYENFNSSKLELFIEKTNKDTYLKIFDSHLINNKTKPKDPNVLSSGVNLNLSNEKFSLETGFSAYEDLNKRQNDRYQYTLPYFKYDSFLPNKYGTINIFSNGNNTLQNTNNLRTRIINDINFSSNDYLISNSGFKSNLNFFIKNVNTVAKEDSIYKSSPQSEIMNILEFNTAYPLKKNTENKIKLLTPKASFRFNPGDMKNHSNSDKTININNIFSVDRLGIEDSLESGKSLTLGLDYTSDNTEQKNTINAKLATVIRDKEENTIPKKTSLNNKNSYLFGAISYERNNLIDLEYNFASDDSLNNVKYHDLGINISLNNFVTNFNFIEENDLVGTAHIIENTSTFNFNENNFLSFKTRKNKEINLTEYYDLIYEYKNDCLTAGLKFKKTFYQDRDLQPSEDIFFYITLIPLTTIEQSIN